MTRATTTARVDVYAALRTAIMEGRLVPHQRLVEAEIMASLGVGRNPVRTALDRLEREGLVERERFRGARVRGLGQHEAVELLEARKAIGVLAIRRSAERVTDEQMAVLEHDLEDCLKASEDGDVERGWTLNVALHTRLIALSGHQTAVWITEQLLNRLFAVGSSIRRTPRRYEQTFTEYRRILDALARHDPDAAADALAAHIDRIIDDVEHNQAGPSELSLGRVMPNGPRGIL